MEKIIYSPLVLILMICAALVVAGLWSLAFQVMRYRERRRIFAAVENGGYLYEGDCASLRVGIARAPISAN